MDKHWVVFLLAVGSFPIGHTLECRDDPYWLALHIKKRQCI